jgi:hypothetical protein
MPVTVKELIVRATVVDTSNDNTKGSIKGKEKEEDRDQIISDCVDQVLQILKSQKER